MLVVKSFSFCLLVYLCSYFSLIFKRHFFPNIEFQDNGYFFVVMKMTFLCHQSAIIVGEKSAVSLDLLWGNLHFPCPTFQLNFFFSLSLIFCSFSMLYLKVGFFLLSLSFWICGFLSFNRFGKLLAGVSSNIVSIPFSLSSRSKELTDWVSPKLK